MDADHAMDDASAGAPTQYAQQISAAEFERQAVEFTTQEPEIGARSEFFQDEENVAKGLPEEEIVAAVDVTEEALNNGPVRGKEEEEYDEEEEQNEAVQNTFYNAEQEGGMVVDDAHVNALMEDVEMEMAAVAIDEQKLLNAAAQRQ
ncbi:hypothetical protein GQ600_13390 [Phytophthora cactorum]|nr:hypothetical protein GQ600_13390 [Phytophthora cactorum]